MNAARITVLTASLLLVLPAFAQQYVYPAKGQSPEQQKSDEAACYTWAVQQTGFDPAKPPQQAAAAAPPTHRDRHDAGRRCSRCGTRRGSGRGRRGRCAHGRRGGRSCRPWPEPPAKCGSRPARAAASASRQPAATTGLRQSARRMPRGQGLQRQIKKVCGRWRQRNLPS